LVSVVPSAIPQRIGVLPESPKGELPHPRRERRAGGCDHPRRSARKGGVDADGEEPRRQEGEESREGAPSHAGIMVAAEGRSSTGRAPVSKTGGCRFESCRPCRPIHAASPHLEPGCAFSRSAYENRLERCRKPLLSDRHYPAGRPASTCGRASGADASRSDPGTPNCGGDAR
jgi:hypothetical protein